MANGRRWNAALALLLGGAPLCSAPSAAASAAESAWAELRDAYVAHALAVDPARATQLGLHDADPRLEPVTQATLASETAWWHAYEARLDAVNAAELTPASRLELGALRPEVRRTLLDLETLRPFERDPGAYVPLVAGAVRAVLVRGGDAACDRLRSATARLRRVPEVLRAAQLNLRRPGRPQTEEALPRFASVLRFYREDIPRSTLECRDSRVLADLAEADSTAVRTVEGFLDYLREDLLPLADDPVTLGAEGLRRRLRETQGLDLDPDSLLLRGGAELKRTARELDSLLAAAPRGADVGATAGGATSPADCVGAALERARQLITRRGLAPLPDRIDMAIATLPAYARGEEIVGLDNAGPWEKKGGVDVLLVDPSAESPGVCRGELELAALREGVPGRGLMSHYARAIPSRARALTSCRSTGDGWAEYAEGLMVEAGFASGDPELLAAALRRRLLRLGRLVAGISLQTGAMTLAEAAGLLEREARIPAKQAREEARRGLVDPDRWVGTVGSWEILALRDEIRSRAGPAFTLGRFHEALFHLGPLPLPLVREEVGRAASAWPRLRRADPR